MLPQHSQLDTHLSKKVYSGMALRVLLADESVTIKKVFQLSLQDFGVEVTTVNVGLDVLQISQKIKPDIVFVDVLLQKKNGYDVCSELKANSDLANIPVVLIWSGFMELDQKKFKACKANADLEKPFDTEKLRSLIQKLVPSTQGHSLSKYLDFPDMPDFEEAMGLPSTKPKPAPKETPSKEATTKKPETKLKLDIPKAPEPTQVINLAANEDPPSFSEVSMNDAPEEEWSMESFSPMKPPQTPPTLESVSAELSAVEEEESEWVSKTLTQYKMDKKKLFEEPEVTYEVPEEKIDPDTLIGNRMSDSLSDIETSQPPKLKKTTAQPADEDDIELDVPTPQENPTFGSTGLDQKQIEAIIRSEARQIIEQVVWEVVPELATQIIEREIKKILKENDERTP